MKSSKKMVLFLVPFLLGRGSPPGRVPRTLLDLEDLAKEVSFLLERGLEDEAARLGRESLKKDPGLPGRLLSLLAPGRKGVFFLLEKALRSLEERGIPTRDLVTALLVRASLSPALAGGVAALLTRGPFLEPCHGDLVVHLYRAPRGDPRQKAGKILLETLLDEELGRGDPVLAFLFLQDRDPLVRSMGALRLCRAKSGYYAPLAPLIAAREKNPQVLGALALGIAFSPLPLGRKARLLLRTARKSPSLTPLLAWHLLQEK